MRIIIVGCGRIGSSLAQTLAMRGHAITVVDKNAEALEQLETNFKGRMLVGVGFDRDVLIEAGIQRADGLAAVTASDEANVVAGRLAQQVFQVPRVVARVYDPRKAAIYHRLGLQTVSPSAWGVNRVADLLTYSQMDVVHSLGSGVDLVEVEATALLVGRSVKDLIVPTEISVIAITRSGKTFLPTLGTVFQEGDQLHLALLSTSADRLKSMLGLG